MIEMIGIVSIEVTVLVYIAEQPLISLWAKQHAL